jgi:hypothetical protein
MKSNKTGYKGVRKRSDHNWRRKPYYARIMFQGQHVYTPNYATPWEAAAAYYWLRKAHPRVRKQKGGLDVDETSHSGAFS